jgi:hypothetical protein
MLGCVVGDDRQLYRAVIDELVRECREGQGQIGPCRAGTGTWNPNADAVLEGLPDQRRINVLLAGMGQDDREALA